MDSRNATQKHALASWVAWLQYTYAFAATATVLGLLMSIDGLEFADIHYTNPMLGASVFMLITAAMFIYGLLFTLRLARGSVARIMSALCALLAPYVLGVGLLIASVILQISLSIVAALLIGVVIFLGTCSFVKLGGRQAIIGR